MSNVASSSAAPGCVPHGTVCTAIMWGDWVMFLFYFIIKRQQQQNHKQQNHKQQVTTSQSLTGAAHWLLHRGQWWPQTQAASSQVHSLGACGTASSIDLSVSLDWRLIDFVSSTCSCNDRQQIAIDDIYNAMHSIDKHLTKIHICMGESMVPW